MMINSDNDIGFIQDVSGLDKLRQQAINGDDGSEKSALHGAAKQFESIFTGMLFKSMRDANQDFKSELFDSQTQDFYHQMLDEQMASDMSKTGSLGLADMIVAQLSTVGNKPAAVADSRPDQLEEAMSRVREYHAHPHDHDIVPSSLAAPSIRPSSRASRSHVFDSPREFVRSMMPHAKKAADALGVEPSLLIAQAALETGWGDKVIKNARGSSNNLFNIKADSRWQGSKVASQTLEYHQHTPVMEKSSFRSYPSYKESFDDYVRFLNENPRYETALRTQTSSEDFIRGVHNAGYATDPSYADKVLQVQAQIDRME
jgi:peptidoglycan hydrolase FlgJ